MGFPFEVVDFIIRSADEALRDHFGVGLTDRNVHILDPFTGTGTFLVRLLQKCGRVVNVLSKSGCFLSGQIVKDFFQFLTNPPVKCLPPVFWNTHNVICAIPSGVT